MKKLMRIRTCMWIPFSSVLLCSLVVSGLITASAQSQQRDLDREILTYILPDSLELPAREVGRILRDRAIIQSSLLANALEELSVTEIAHTFHDWSADDSVRVRDDGVIVHRPRLDRIFTIYLPSSVSADAAIERLEKEPSVLYAEKHIDARLFNDPQYSNQWHLNNTGQAGGTAGADIRAEQAWGIFTGSTAIKIGIFDSGVELSHGEFTGKIFGDNRSSTGSEAYWSHGTHVAGIAAARYPPGKPHLV